MLLLYCGWSIFVITQSALGGEDKPPIIYTICVTVMLLPMIAVAITYIIGALKVYTQKKSVWVLQIVLVAIGTSSLLTLVPCIFLLMSLLSDEVQDYYKK
ncbi:hypothetical protein JW766_06105 [Candidatus Dojkabacteria bacterium]|nr:hypothetical protein [Candidatus Dojkabacteria bacterium]